MDEPGASWADRMEDLDATELSPDNLPAPKETIRGDVKTIVSYELEDDRIKKVTRVYKVQRKRVPKAVAARKKWSKFGDAATDNKSGPDPATTKIADEVFLVLTTNTTDLEQDDDPLKKLRDQQKGMVTCRLCKGDHWTSRCPYKDSLGTNTIKDLEESVNKPDASGGPAPSLPTASAPPGAGAGPGSKYVPPNQRGGENRRGEMMSGSRSNRDDDQSTVRVTNLSEETQEVDLKELFSHFGPIRRTFLAKDKVTQQSKGFAFVSFHEREHAAKAIRNLNGFGYDHLILKVEWAKPSKQ